MGWLKSETEDGQQPALVWPSIVSEKGEKGSKSIQTRRETAAEASVALVGCKKVSAAEFAVLTWYVVSWDVHCSHLYKSQQLGFEEDMGWGVTLLIWPMKMSYKLKKRWVILKRSQESPIIYCTDWGRYVKVPSTEELKSKLRLGWGVGVLPRCTPELRGGAPLVGWMAGCGYKRAASTTHVSWCEPLARECPDILCWRPSCVYLAVIQCPCFLWVAVVTVPNIIPSLCVAISCSGHCCVSWVMLCDMVMDANISPPTCRSVVQ